MNWGKLNLSALKNFNQNASLTSVKISSIIEEKPQEIIQKEEKPRFSLKDLKPENCCLKFRKEDKKEIKIWENQMFFKENPIINIEEKTQGNKEKKKITLSSVSIKSEEITEKKEEKPEEKKVLFSDWHTHSFMEKSEEEEIFSNYSCDDFQAVKETIKDKPKEENKKKNLNLNNFKEEKTIVIDSKINNFSLENIKKFFAFVNKKWLMAFVWVFIFAISATFIANNLTTDKPDIKANILENKSSEIIKTEALAIPLKVEISKKQEKEILWSYLKDIYQK